MKFISFLFLLIPSINSITIICRYERVGWDVVGGVYACIQSNNPSITLSGTAVNGNQNENVQAYFSDSKTIQFMPHGLGNLFPNLIAIRIKVGRIKEIHQEDFQQFPKLKYLNLESNDIEILEKNLFNFNPQLQFIRFWKNKIKEIFPTVFDNLQQLRWLDMDENYCMTGEKKDRQGVLELVKEMREKCKPDIYVLLDNIEVVFSRKVETQNENLERFKQEIVQKFSNISKLEIKFNNLMTNQNKQNENIQNLTIKLQNEIQETFKNLNETLDQQVYETMNEVSSLTKQYEHFKVSIFETIKNLEKNINQQQEKKFELEISKIQNFAENITKNLVQHHLEMTKDFLDFKIKQSENLENFIAQIIKNNSNLETNTRNDIESLKMNLQKFNELKIEQKFQQIDLKLTTIEENLNEKISNISFNNLKEVKNFQVILDMKIRNFTEENKKTENSLKYELQSLKIDFQNFVHEIVNNFDNIKQHHEISLNKINNQSFQHENLKQKLEENFKEIEKNLSRINDENQKNLESKFQEQEEKLTKLELKLSEIIKNSKMNFENLNMNKTKEIQEIKENHALKMAEIEEKLKAMNFENLKQQNQKLEREIQKQNEEISNLKSENLKEIEKLKTEIKEEFFESFEAFAALKHENSSQNFFPSFSEIIGENKMIFIICASLFIFGFIGIFIGCRFYSVKNEIPQSNEIIMNSL